jgi:DNA adenine methylase Dam
MIETIVENKSLKSKVNACLSTKPFLKWAGGKTQMLEPILSHLPNDFNNYIEPFIGGGAVFFSLGHRKSIISDLNEELIITYIEVRDNVEMLIKNLSRHSHTEEHFYATRQMDLTTLSNSERAARLIFLNKTCFNGLYRVNKKGEFNVPYGKGKGSFLNEENLKSASLALKETKIIHSEYSKVIKQYAKRNDFIFLDPPYQPVGKNADFKRYTKEFFYEKDQIQLAEEFKSLVKRGCKVMLTNSDHPFILDLYKDYEIIVCNTKRMISSSSKTRTGKDIIVKGGY